VEDIHLMLEHMIVKAIKEQAYPETNFTEAIVKYPADILGD
jgi:hypothetical protein